VVEYRGALTEDDYAEIVRLRRQVLQEAGTAEDALVWFAVGFLVLAIWGYFGSPERNPDSLWWLAFALPCLAVWWFRRARPRKQWRKTPELRAEQWGEVTDGSLRARFLGEDAVIPWAFFSSQRQSSKALVLFVGTHLHVMLARGFFQSDDAWREAGSIIAEKVPGRQVRVGATLRTVLLWLGFLVVIFLAWHFAQLPRK